MELLNAIADGEHAALEALYHRHARWLLQRLTHRCADHEIVDNALQDTFVSAWRSASSFRTTHSESADAGGWLWTIAVRRLIDHMRRRPAPTPTAHLPEPEPLPPPGTDAYELLARLPGELHQVVSAVYLDGLTTEEAAVLLRIPRGTVKSRLHRARALLNEGGHR
jgi:RNA polymerase sigma-70 factor, ECF subfamily